MSEAGRAEAARAAKALSGVTLADVVSSPLQRAVQCAEIVSENHGIQVARDPRLVDFDLGKWTGMTYAEVAANPEYQRFLANPLSETIPGGERFADIQARAVAAVEQALSDSPSGDAIAVVTHAGVIRVLLAHYLGSPPANYHRIRVSPGSISVLSFADDRELPRVLTTNHVGSLERALSH